MQELWAHSVHVLINIILYQINYYVYLVIIHVLHVQEALEQNVYFVQVMPIELSIQAQKLAHVITDILIMVLLYKLA